MGHPSHHFVVVVVVFRAHLHAWLKLWHPHLRNFLVGRSSLEVSRLVVGRLEFAIYYAN